MSKYLWSFLLAVGVVGFGFGQSLPNRPVSVSFQQVPLAEALSRIEAQTRIPFSYTEDLLPDTLVSGVFDRAPLPGVLDELLTPLGLHCEYTFGVLVLKPGVAAARKRVVLSGYVEDGETGERLVGVKVYDAISKQGVLTNEHGYFRLESRRDSAKLAFSMVGYGVYAEKVSLNDNLRSTVRLHSNLSLATVEIRDQAFLEVGQVGGGASIHFSRKNLLELPGFMGEADVLASLKLLPGINVGGEGSGGLYVRGGGPDQNLVLMDGVPIYNSSHLFGFFSIFNGPSIKDIQLFKSGFPARYGGRLSSVINIRMKEGDEKRLRLSGSLGLVSAGLQFEGPLVKDKLTFVISGRRTLMDPYFKVLNRFAAMEDGNFLGYYFYDVNGKLNWQVGKRDQISLTFYTGADQLESGYEIEANSVRDLFDFDLGWGNMAGILSWRRDWTPRLFTEVSTYGTEYRYRSVSATELDYLGQRFERHELTNTSLVREIGSRLNLEWLPRKGHFVRMGGGVVQREFQPEIFQFSAIEIGVDTLQDRVSQTVLRPVEANLYFEDQIEIGRLWSFNLGLHNSYYQQDSTRFVSLQPRLSMRFGEPGKAGIYGGFSTMAQNLHLLSNSGVGLPTDLWVPATAAVAPEQSRQWYLGVDKRFGRAGLDISIEGYYKEMRNLIDYQTGSNFLGDLDWQERVEKGGIGSSYGVEVFVRKRARKWEGWLGYTWAKTTRQFESINEGNPFPYKYDRRHDLSAVAIFRPTKRTEFSGTWVYGTGTAITFPEAVFYSPTNSALDFWSLNDGNEVNVVIDYSERNSFRLPAYHRLDLNFKYQWKEWLDLHLGLYNVYNRRNPYFLFLRADYSSDPNAPQIKARKMSLLPILPSVKLGFHL